MNISTIEKTMNLLEQTGLNWEVKKEGFTHPSGLITEHYGLFKYMPGSDVPSACLGAVKGRYTVFQNYDLADTVVRATEGIGLTATRGGQMSGGKKVYLQAALPDEYVGKSGVRRYVTCVNSHDGSASIAFGSTNTVIVCQNTFFRAYRESTKFKHTAGAQSRIDEAIEQFQATVNADKALFDTFKRMSELRPDENLVQAIIKRIFDVTPKTNTEDISTRKKNQVLAFGKAYNIERDLEGDTVWGLFNAVTRYTNHMAAPSAADRKTEYIMAGGGYAINNASYETIMAWVEENTTPKTIMVMN